MHVRRFACFPSSHAAAKSGLGLQPSSDLTTFLSGRYADVVSSLSSLVYGFLLDEFVIRLVALVRV